MIITVSAKLNPELLYEKGIEAGLSEVAANFFRYLSEIELELYVDAENGAVCGAKVKTNFN